MNSSRFFERIKIFWKDETFLKRFKKMAPYCLHTFMVLVVVLYTICGAFIIRNIEAKKRMVSDEELNNTNLAQEVMVEEDNWDYWTMTDALLFCFSIITTIGYGNVTPETDEGRLFVIIYGLIGVPLTLIVMANLGKFLSEFLKKMTQRCMSFLRNDKNYVRINDHLYERIYSVECSLIIAFIIYIFIGSFIIASYEPDMNVFKAIYFNFVTVTTIGLGDLVPKRGTYLLVTLLYVTVGLALTTIAIEIAADYLRKLHYFGRKIENVHGVNIWFGGKKLTLRQLINNFGDQLNLDMDVVNQLDLDEFVNNAIKVEAGERPSLRCQHIKPIKPIIATDFKDIYSEDQIMFIDEDEFVIVYTFKKRMDLYGL